MEVFYLLFLLSAFEPRIPNGIYREEAACVKDGKLIESVVGRKFKCVPVTAAVLRYYEGRCLTDFVYPEQPPLTACGRQEDKPAY